MKRPRMQGRDWASSKKYGTYGRPGLGRADIWRLLSLGDDCPDIGCGLGCACDRVDVDAVVDDWATVHLQIYAEAKIIGKP